MSAAWPDPLQILQDRLANRRHKWINMRATLLRTPDGNRLAGPIQVPKAQAAHFAAAQSVGGQQHQDGSVPNVSIPRPTSAVDQSPNILPIWTAGQHLVLKNTRGFDGGGDTTTAPFARLGMSKEATEHGRFRPDGQSAAALFTLQPQKAVDVIDGNPRERSFACDERYEKVFQKHVLGSNRGR